MENLQKKLDFARPPVDEVVLSVLFQSLDNLLAPHLGQIWQEFKEDGFVQIEEQPPANPIVEEFSGRIPEPQLQFLRAPHLARIWFTPEDRSEILQVQRDRFTFNWCKTKPSQQYPGFSFICDKFERFYDRFCKIMRDMKIGEVTPLQYELTYIDQIRQGDGWDRLNDIGKIYNLFVDFQNSDSFWSETESLMLRTSFTLPNLHSRLHLTISNRVKMPEESQTLQTDFTLRGFPENTNHTMIEWFKSAREQIQEKFVSLFTESIQTQIWGRK